MMYDLCIVGSGMIGSAAARHATLSPGISVCLIGPSEPKERHCGNGRDIYGAYYDEARITRSCSSDVVWAKLALSSIRRYRDIENQSGITFYHEVGNIMAGSGDDSEFLKSVRTTAKNSGVKTKPYTYKTFRQQFHFLKVPDNLQAELETQDAGYINPRKMVEAQIKLATQQGCTVINDVVYKVERNVQSDGTYTMRVVSEGGRIIMAKKVLLATGGFTHSRDLVPNVRIDYKFIPRIVALAEVDFTKEEMKPLKHMPCFIYEGPPHKDWKMMYYSIGRPETSLYIMPPVQYPDGRYYIKAGVLDPFPITLETKDEIKQWYDSGDLNMLERLKEVVQSLFNDVQFVNMKGDTCGIMQTPTGRPYIDMIHDQLGVALGGNGRAAKSSDEIGRLASSMMLHGWSSELPQHIFTLKYCAKSKL